MQKKVKKVQEKKCRKCKRTDGYVCKVCDLPFCGDHPDAWCKVCS